MPRAALLLLAIALSACSAPKSRVDRWRTALEERRKSVFEDGQVLVPARLRSSAASPAARRDRARRRVLVVGSAAAGLHLFDVSDLTRGVRDFAAPSIGDLRPPGERPDPSEELGEPVALLSDDVLVDLIRAGVLPGTWEEDGVSVRVENGLLIVRHP